MTLWSKRRKSQSKPFQTRWQTDRWRRQHPALAEAYRVVVKGFSQIEEVVGIGIGRRFRESKGRYGPKSSFFGGLCIQVLVRQKRPLKGIPRLERIPKFIALALSPRGKKYRVPVDILTAGAPALQSNGYQHIWPTAGQFNVGRIFAFDRVRQANAQNGQYGAKEAELGTTGALIQTGNKQFAIVSAGHVFVEVCGGNLSAPAGYRRVGVLGPQWWALNPGNLAPDTLQNGAWIMDALCMRIPGATLPQAVSWPPLFDKRLASPDDIKAAIDADEVGGFVWVERAGGQYAGLPIDLQAGLDVFSPEICQSSVTNYRYVWPYRLIGGVAQQTVGGDSGAGIFVPAIDKPGFCRLLAFHFLHDGVALRGYGLDASVFFKRLFGPQAVTALTFA